MSANKKTPSATPQPGSSQVKALPNATTSGKKKGGNLVTPDAQKPQPAHKRALEEEQDHPETAEAEQERPPKKRKGKEKIPAAAQEIQPPTLDSTPTPAQKERAVRSSLEIEMLDELSQAPPSEVEEISDSEGEEEDIEDDDVQETGRSSFGDLVKITAANFDALNQAAEDMEDDTTEEYSVAFVNRLKAFNAGVVNQFTAHRDKDLRKIARLESRITKLQEGYEQAKKEIAHLKLQGIRQANTSSGNPISLPSAPVGESKPMRTLTSSFGAVTLKKASSSSGKKPTARTPERIITFPPVPLPEPHFPFLNVDADLYETYFDRNMPMVIASVYGRYFHQANTDNFVNDALTKAGFPAATIVHIGSHKPAYALCVFSDKALNVDDLLRPSTFVQILPNNAVIFREASITPGKVIMNVRKVPIFLTQEEIEAEAVRVLEKQGADPESIKVARLINRGAPQETLCIEASPKPGCTIQLEQPEKRGKGITAAPISLELAGRRLPLECGEICTGCHGGGHHFNCCPLDNAKTVYTSGLSTRGLYPTGRADRGGPRGRGRGAPRGQMSA